MELFTVLVVAAALMTSPALAFGDGLRDALGDIEVGTLFGYTSISSPNSDASTVVALPGGSGVFGNPSLYISRFLTEQLSFGSEVSFGRITDSEDDIDSTISAIFVGPRVAFYPQGHAISGPYFMGKGAFMRGSTTVGDYSDSEKAYAAGLCVGYQWRQGALVLRAEGGAKQWWFDEGEKNEIFLLLGLGVREAPGSRGEM